VHSDVKGAPRRAPEAPGAAKRSPAPHLGGQARSSLKARARQRFTRASREAQGARLAAPKVSVVSGSNPQLKRVTRPASIS